MASEPFPRTPGDWIHIGEIIAMLITIGMFVQTMKYTESQVDRHTVQLDRIEHYLSSRDPEYWQRTKEGLTLPALP
jgi:hypothetical protein